MKIITSLTLARNQLRDKSLFVIISIFEAVFVSHADVKL